MKSRSNVPMVMRAFTEEYSGHDAAACPAREGGRRRRSKSSCQSSAGKLGSPLVPADPSSPRIPSPAAELPVCPPRCAVTSDHTHHELSWHVASRSVSTLAPAGTPSDGITAHSTALPPIARRWRRSFSRGPLQHLQQLQPPPRQRRPGRPNTLQRSRSCGHAPPQQSLVQSRHVEMPLRHVTRHVCTIQ